MSTKPSAFIAACLLLVGCSASVVQVDAGNARDLVGVSAGTAGVVRSLYPDGAHVKKGDLIAELEAGDAERRLFLARAALTASRRADHAGARSAQREFDHAAQDLTRGQLRAPVDGTIVARAVQIGQPVSAGTVVVAIAPDSRAVLLSALDHSSR